MSGVNLSYSDLPADIGNDVANVLCFLNDMLILPHQGDYLQISPDGVSGLYVILEACRHTLRQINHVQQQ